MLTKKFIKKFEEITLTILWKQLYFFNLKKLIKCLVSAFIFGKVGTNGHELCNVLNNNNINDKICKKCRLRND